MNKVVNVAVGVIIRESETIGREYFLTKRLEHVHQGSKWEFPGGKVESDETVHEALFRELKEEIAIEVIDSKPLITIKHDYIDKSVCLEVYMVESYTGEPSAQEGQGQGWFSLEQLTSLQFPEANKEIITELVKLSH